MENDMEAASTSWRSLGDILVERGLISPDDLERALAEEFATKRRLADVLVRRGLVSGHDITAALMEQMTRIGREDETTRPQLKAIEAESHDRSGPEESVETDSHIEPNVGESPQHVAPDEPADVLPAEDESPASPAATAADIAATAGERLSQPPEDFVRQTEGRRVAAESHMSMLGGIGEGLERLRAELEAQDLTTPPLVRELQATRERVQTRKQALADEIAQLQRSREAVERTSAELEQLRGDLGGKLSELSALQATAEMWNSRVAELEAEVDTQLARIDSLSRELALLVEGEPPTPAMHAVTEVHPQPDAEAVPAETPVVAVPGETHLLFVPQDEGYELVEQAGPPPDVGESIEFGAATWVVTRIGPSPISLDERACVFFSAG